MKKYLFLDCDSTLCAIEGVDELAALRGPETEAEVIRLTNDAMDGKVPIEEVFGRRLALISPTSGMCREVARQYQQTLLPRVSETLALLRQAGWTPIIVSGGFTPVIEPLAHELCIHEIHAVDLHFDDDGNYAGFNESAPTARNGGKPEIIRNMLSANDKSLSVMVGDGVSDLETKSTVDLFVGFGGVVARDKVKAGAIEFIHDFGDLPSILEKHF